MDPTKHRFSKTCALLLVAQTVAQSAAAQETTISKPSVSATPEPAQAPSGYTPGLTFAPTQKLREVSVQKSTRYYGIYVLMTDVCAFPSYAVKTGDGDSDFLALLVAPVVKAFGIPTFTLHAPIVHLRHKAPGKALASLLLRAALPLSAYFTFKDKRYSVMGAAGLAGAIDHLFLFREETSARPFFPKADPGAAADGSAPDERKKQTISLSPSLGVAQRGFVLGANGTF